MVYLRSSVIQPAAAWIRVLSIGAVGAALAALFMGSTLLTPLYGVWSKAYGFSPLVLTLLYAVYVLGNLAALFLAGRLSDQAGRRRVVLAGLAVAGASAVLFLLAPGPAWLFVARALSGLAIGMGSSACTAWIAELTPEALRSNAASTATGANFLGLTLGPVTAGLLAQYAIWPTRLCFVVYLVVLALAALAAGRIEETAQPAQGDEAHLSLRPRIGVPADIRADFLAPAVTVFVTMAVIGFYAAVGPSVMRERLGIDNLLVSGVIVALLFAAAAAVVALTRTLPSRTAMLLGLAAMPPAVGLLAGADAARSLPLLLLAAATGGVACALGYRGSLQVINLIAPQDRRGEVTSSYLIAAFCGNALPVIGVGVISTLWRGPAAGVIFAAVIAVLALAAFAWALRRRNG